MNQNNDLYQQQILEEAKYPKNVGELADADVVRAEHNTSCGDQVTVALKLSEDKKKVVDVRWQGSGCAISTAATSVLSEIIKGLTVKAVLLYESDQLLASLGLKQISPARRKCLNIGLLTIKRALVEHMQIEEMKPQ